MRICSEVQDFHPKSCINVGGMHSCTIVLKSSRSLFCRLGLVEGWTPHRLTSVLSSLAGEHDSSCSCVASGTDSRSLSTSCRRSMKTTSSDDTLSSLPEQVCGATPGAGKEAGRLLVTCGGTEPKGGSEAGRQVFRFSTGASLPSVRCTVWGVTLLASLQITDCPVLGSTSPTFLKGGCPSWGSTSCLPLQAAGCPVRGATSPALP